jgi:hypothetical protein
LKDKGFEFTNLDTVPVDISGWNIVFDEKVLELPQFSIVASKKTVIIPFDVFNINDVNINATLQTPERNSVSFKQEVVDQSKIKSQIVPTLFFSKEESLPQESLQAVAADAFVQDPIASAPKQKSAKNKTIVFSIALFVVIGMFVLLERFMASRED